MIVKVSACLVVLFAAVRLTAAPAASQSPILYPGERVEQFAGYPAMVRFYKGDPAKPLLVFVPGSQHLARISYGCPTCRPDDFIAYWLQHEGYNFLAVSYPVVSESPVFDKAYPDFTAQVWGNQVALAAQQAIRANGLTNKIVLLHWSMAGKVIEPATEASRKRGLEVEAAISLAASPGLPRETPVAMKMSAEGIIHKDDDYQDWLGQLRADDAENEGRKIIPPSTYTKEFVGDMAVNLQGNGEVFRDGAFVEDTDAQTRDYGVFVSASIR